MQKNKRVFAFHFQFPPEILDAEVMPNAKLFQRWFFVETPTEGQTLVTSGIFIDLIRFQNVCLEHSSG